MGEDLLEATKVTGWWMNLSSLDDE